MAWFVFPEYPKGCGGGKSLIGFFFGMVELGIVLVSDVQSFASFCVLATLRTYMGIGIGVLVQRVAIATSIQGMWRRRIHEVWVARTVLLGLHNRILDIR